MDVITKAISIAAYAHMGQKDLAGKPYIFHALRVMNAVQSDIEKAVAVLHDVIEDGRHGLYFLKFHEFPPVVIEAVDALTRKDGEEYDDYIERVALNPIAVKVKIADLCDNMDIFRLPTFTDRDRARNRKYSKALRRLYEVEVAAAD